MNRLLIALAIVATTLFGGNVFAGDVVIGSYNSNYHGYGYGWGSYYAPSYIVGYYAPSYVLVPATTCEQPAAKPPCGCKPKPVCEPKPVCVSSVVATTQVLILQPVVVAETLPVIVCTPKKAKPDPDDFVWKSCGKGFTFSGWEWVLYDGPAIPEALRASRIKYRSDVIDGKMYLSVIIGQTARTFVRR